MPPRYDAVLLGKSKQPRINVSLRIPHLHLSGAFPFLIDTGADETTLSARFLKRPAAQFGVPTSPTRGAGGEAKRWLIKREKRLRITNGTNVLDITPEDVYVLENSPICLIGRDVLEANDLSLFLDSRGGICYLEEMGRVATTSVPVSVPEAAPIRPSGQVPPQ